MNARFPLFNSLLSSAPEQDLTAAEKKEFATLAGQMDQKGCEYSYVLIKMYAQQREDDYKSYTLPYGGKSSGFDLQYDLEKLPFVLKQMVIRFMRAHSKSMREIEEENSKRADLVTRLSLADYEKLLT